MREINAFKNLFKMFGYVIEDLKIVFRDNKNNTKTVTNNKKQTKKSDLKDK